MGIKMKPEKEYILERSLFISFGNISEIIIRNINIAH
jgi:hypothetical protein